MAQYGIGEQYTDLRRRLTALTERGDYGRRHAMTLAHRHPYRSGEISETLFADLASPHATAADAAIASARRLLDCGGIRIQLEDFQTDCAPEAHLDQLQKRLEAAQQLCAQAFAGLTAEEAAFARAQFPALMAAFENQIYIDADEDAARRAGNLRLAELAGKIRYEPLMDAAFLLSSLWHGGYTDALRADLAAAGMDLTQPVILQRDTPAGRIVIGGIGNDWYKSVEQISAALLIDLGGDDFIPTRRRLPPPTGPSPLSSTAPAPMPTKHGAIRPRLRPARHRHADRHGRRRFLHRHAGLSGRGFPRHRPACRYQRQ